MMATVGTVRVRLVLEDRVSPALNRLSWRLLTLDGQWHAEQMKADRLRQKPQA